MSATGVVVSGLTPGNVYGALVHFWAEATAPDVRLVAAGELGPTSDIKERDTDLTMAFIATDTTHEVEIIPATPGKGGDIWIAAFAVTDNLNVIGYFDGNTPLTQDGAHEWTGTPHASTSVTRQASREGATRIAVSWRPRRWLVI